LASPLVDSLPFRFAFDQTFSPSQHTNWYELASSHSH
jgi:hypothetical protein